MNLLIVDDQHSLHQYLDKVLDYHMLGFDGVRHAYCGQEALESCLEQMPDIMLLDIEMPRMNGLALLESLSERGLLSTGSSRNAVIILSAYNDFPYVQQCLRYGVSNYILKPIDPDELIESLSVVRSRLKAVDKNQIAPHAVSQDMLAAACQEATANGAVCMDQVCVYISQNYQQDLTLESVAAHFYLSKYQLSRQFSQEKKITYQDYLAQVRMEAAARLLRTTTLKLYEIASQVGFNDSNYFSSAFKRYYGLSPREYRNKVQHDTNSR